MDDPDGFDVDRQQAKERFARYVLGIEGLPERDELTGLRPADRWTNDWFAAVLFLDRDDRGYEVAYAMCDDAGRWQVTGGGGVRPDPSRRFDDPGVPGLHRVGGGASGVVRVTVVLACPRVATIRLRSDLGERDRSLGPTRYALLGITHDDPLTYAVGVTATGQHLGEPLLL